MDWRGLEWSQFQHFDPLLSAREPLAYLFGWGRGASVKSKIVFVGKAHGRTFKIGKNRDDALAWALNWRNPMQSILATKNIKRTWVKQEFVRARITAL